MQIPCTLHKVSFNAYLNLLRIYISAVPIVSFPHSIRELVLERVPCVRVPKW